MKYYIAIDKNDVIWGIGESPELAATDAKENLENKHPKLKTLECTKEVFDDVFVNGYYHGDDEPYWFYDKKKKIAYYPAELKRENVFKTLP